MASEMAENPRPGAILVVDDDPVLRSALALILEGEGHEVIEAADGPSAIEAAHKRRPDLLLVDYVMVGMNGAMLLDQMRAQLQGGAPPAVLLTSGEERFERTGGVCGLEKPFNVPELLDVVQRHLEQTRRDAS